MSFKTIPKLPRELLATSCMKNQGSMKIKTQIALEALVWQSETVNCENFHVHIIHYFPVH
jgi:hypothetical protein